MERIVEIEEVFNRDDKGQHTDKWGTKYDGFSVKTETQEIFLGISNGQCCCEDWGYFMSDDTTEDFHGAILHDITLTDTCLNTMDAHY